MMHLQNGEPRAVLQDPKYFEKYQGVGKEIYLFGVAFADRNLGDWALEKL